MGMLPVVARAAPHFGEEPCISGTRGSGTVFFCGCALGCVFCQNADISRAVPRTARTLDAGALGALFAELADKGVHNINLVTASHFVPVVAEALRRCPPGIPVVYNCGGYESVQTLRMLEGLVDVYLPDYKFADADTAAVCAPPRPNRLSWTRSAGIRTCCPCTGFVLRWPCRTSPGPPTPGFWQRGRRRCRSRPCPTARWPPPG